MRSRYNRGIQYAPADSPERVPVGNNVPVQSIADTVLRSIDRIAGPRPSTSTEIVQRDPI